jgi:tryptophan 2,3-dioxygenase
MSYGEYLHLDELLNCQHPRTEQHDEMLFVIIHQATELWMKLAVHELQAALEQLRADDLPPAFKRAGSRVSSRSSSSPGTCSRR